MASIFYNTNGNAKNEPYNGPSYNRLNANRIWANHQYNRFVLNHIANHSDNFNEKHQARKELEICDRKIKWAERHPNFEEIAATYILKQTFKISR